MTAPGLEKPADVQHHKGATLGCKLTGFLGGALTGLCGHVSADSAALPVIRLAPPGDANTRIRALAHGDPDDKGIPKPAKPRHGVHLNLI